MRTTFIYALCEPETGKIRYVGKANNPKRRFRRHLRETIGQETHTGRWIKLLASNGEKPELEILDEVPDSQWSFWEREYIRVFRALGMNLTNISEGGGQVPALRGEHHPNFGKKESAEATEKRISKIRGKTHTEESKANMSAGALGRVLTPEHCANIGKAQKGRVASEETRARMSTSQTARREREKGII